MKLFFFVFILFPIATLAGTITSGGGGSIVCRSIFKNIKSARLLDLYEGEVRYKYDIQTSKADPKIQVVAALAKLGPGGFYQVKTQEFITSVLNKFEFLPKDLVLAAPEDLGGAYGIVLPNGCALEGVGYYESGNSLKVAKPVYKAFSNTDRAAFIVHEALYKLARDTSEATDSSLSRQLTAALFASNSTPQEIQSLASKIIFAQTEWQRYPRQFIVLNDQSGDIVFNLIPSVLNARYYFTTECHGIVQYPPVSPYQKHELVGRSQISVKDEPCEILSLTMPSPPEEGLSVPPMSFKYEVFSAGRLIFKDDNSLKNKDSGFWQSLYIARPSILPSIPKP